MERVNCLNVTVMVLGAVSLAGLISGCSASSPMIGTTAPPVEIVETGSWYVRYEWPHDGEPYESEHLVVYSDTSSLEARVAVAELGERLLADIVSEMGIGNPAELFRFPTDQDKIEIYAFRDQPRQDWGGRAYYGGLLIHAMDHEGWLGPTDPETYGTHLKHELVHVVASLLKGRGPTEAPWVNVWFSEGLAETMSGGAASRGINGLDHLDSLTDEYGSLNPVSYRSDGQVCTVIDAACLKAYNEYHYPTWYLAVEYLLDDNGMGRSAADAAAVFVDMADGATFRTAFDDHMGITLAEYEEQFFARMDTYLPARSGSIAFTPLGLVLISLITVGIAVTASIRNVQSSPAAMAADPGTESFALTRGSRIAFSVWIGVAVALSLFLFLRGVVQIGGSRTLEDGEKVLGLAVLVAYLGVSTAVLTWAVRRRRHHSGAAWLIPLLAIVTAGITIIAINVMF